MKTLTILFALLIICSLPVTSQEVQNPPEQMQKLDFLIGTWEGKGWIIGREKQIPLKSVEVVQKKLGGNALLVEGTHRGRSPSGEENVILFEAMALLTYDAETDKYLWRSATSRGRGGNFEAKVIGDDTLHWGKPNSFRYIITIDEDGRWHEIGESTRDGGKIWHQFFEMTLERKE